MKPNVLITGVSSGIGAGLCQAYSARDFAVYGVSRRPLPADIDIHHRRCDLAEFDSVDAELAALLSGVEHLDLVILNAGVLGHLADMADASLSEMRNTMDINLWANQVVLESLFRRIPRIDQVVAVSSGAAVNGSKGWNGYSLSKAALNMLVKLYAKERPDTHFIAFAPGLVDTAMQDQLCGMGDEDDAHFPSLRKLKDARGTERMPAPSDFGEIMADVVPKLLAYDSGAFVDIRTMG